MLQPMISMRIIGSESIDGQLVRSLFDTAFPDRLRQRPFRPETVRSCFGCDDPLHDEGVGGDTRVIRIATFPMREYRASRGGLERADAEKHAVGAALRDPVVMRWHEISRAGAILCKSQESNEHRCSVSGLRRVGETVVARAIADVLDTFIRAPIDLELPSAKLPKASALLLSGRTQHRDVLRGPLFRWTETADHRLRRDSVQQ